jgi:hypothetical protein
MEFIKLWRLLEGIEVECIAEAGRLVILVRDISKVLVDLGMPCILGIPRDPRMANDILEVMGVILERLREAYASSHDPWDQAPSTSSRHFLRPSSLSLLFNSCM